MKKRIMVVGVMAVAAFAEVKIKASATGTVRPTGGGFADTTVTLVADDLPQWMAGGRLGVNGDGNIVLSVVPGGTMWLFT